VNRKNIFETLGIGLTIITLLFGDNIYFQVTGKPFFTSTNIKLIVVILAIVLSFIWIAVLLYRRANEFVLDTNRRFISCSLSNGKFNHIISFVFYGKNKSSKPIIHISGFLRSNITNETHPVYLHDNEKGKSVPPANTNGIPPKCDDVTLVIPFVITQDGESDHNSGIPLEKFLATLVDSTLTLKLDDRIYTYRIPERKVRSVLEAIERDNNPPAKPRVTLKEND